MPWTNDASTELAEFLSAWPISRVQTMTLEEYTNSDRDTAFIYWLEKKTEDLGSIWGGSAFKFGIYKRRSSELVAKPMVKTDGIYAWLSKYGAERDEAFKNVKNIILQIVTAASANELEVIDKIDLGDAVKWKIAYLYNSDNIIPIFNPEVLFRAAEGNGFTGPKSSPISQLHHFLFSIKPSSQNTTQYAQVLWNKFQLDNIYPTIEKFLAQAQSDNIVQLGFQRFFKKLQIKVSFGRGLVAQVPWIAFLQEPNRILSGIYPVYFYFKSHNLLILSYGVSEHQPPTAAWPNAENLQKIGAWFLETKNVIEPKYSNCFIHTVYDLNEELNEEKVQTDLDDILNEYLSIDFKVSSNDQIIGDKRRTWLIAPGEGASFWDEFYEKGIIGIGWDEIGDLSRFNSKYEVKQALIDLYPEGSKGQTHNSLALWQFSREIKPNDIVIPKRGVSEYLGYGIVRGHYYFDHDRDRFKHLIKVDWQKKGVWPEAGGRIVTKTLTDLSDNPNDVDRLKRLIGIEQTATVDIANIDYYWIKANPKYWKIGDYQVGQEQGYNTHNEKGNKRTALEHFQNIKPGDLLLGYETSNIQKVVAIFECTQGIHLDEDSGKEEISFKIQKFLSNPISWDTLKSIPSLESSEVMRNKQGSLLKLNKTEFDTILELDQRVSPSIYSIEDAEKDIFLERMLLERIIDSLGYKKNIILQGPPGVGKTYMAKKLAYLLMEEKDDSKIEMVQFHQSYSYEDFMQGYRPKENGTFKLENGVFYRFCKKAQADQGSKYFYIIDEVNRGNLSKIFGELMLLMEADKRGPAHAVSLTYTSSTENKFFIPENVYIIGTMNTADRSLAIVDYALRRRFAFIDVCPLYNLKFKMELSNLGVDEGIIDPLVNKITALNTEIANDPSLRKGFLIGHSYFCNVPKDTGDIEWYHNIITHEISPLLREYWFDNEPKAEMEISRLYLD